MKINDAIKKTAPIFLVFTLIIAVAVFFSINRNEETYPKLTNPNETYATISNEKITDEEMYTVLLETYGLNQIQEILNENLLAKYIELAKKDESFNVDEELETIIYGTTLELAELTLSEEEINDKELEFKENLTFNGFTEDEYKELLYMDKAIELYTRTYLEGLYKTDELYKVSDVITYYGDELYEKVYAINVEYATVEEGLAALAKFGYTPYMDELYKTYTVDGEVITPEDVRFPVDSTSLKPTNEEALELYVKLYNDKYPTRTPLEIKDGVVVGYEDNKDLLFNFDDIDTPQLSNYLFKVLDTETNPYSKTAKALPVTTAGDSDDTRIFLTYKIAGDNLKDAYEAFFNTGEDGSVFNESAELEKNAYDYKVEKNQELFDNTIKLMIEDDALDATNQKDAINKLRSDAILTIEDPRLNKLYKETIDKDLPDLTNNRSYVFRYNNIEVTTDEFFKDLNDRYGAINYINLANEKYLTSNKELSDKVITEDLKSTILTNLNTLKYNFTSGAYAQYGLTLDTTTWEDFLKTQFGSSSEVDYYNNQIISELNRVFLLEELRDTNKELHYQNMLDAYNNEFSLNTKHVLVYSDQDNDDSPDKEVSEDIDTLMNELASNINKELAAITDVKAEDLDNIITKYDEATNEDEVYGKYKVKNIKVLTEVIPEVTVESPLEQAYLDGAQEIYNNIESSESKKGITTKPYKTSYGYHIIFGDEPVERISAFASGDKKVPTTEEVDAYFDKPQDATEEMSAFIEKFYLTPLNEYTNDRVDVTYSKARKDAGEVISNSKIKPTVDDIVAIYEARYNRLK